MSSAITKSAILLALCCLFGVGCSSEPPLQPVSGTVTYKGKPVAVGEVLFEDPQQGIALAADLKDGEYVLKTYKGAGLPPGNYRVSITPPRQTSPTGMIPPPPPPCPDIPKKYREARTSGFSAVITPGTNTPFNFEMVD